MYAQCNMEALSYNHSCRGRAVSITLSESVSVFLTVVLRHVERLHSLTRIFSSLVWPAVLYFPIFIS